MNQKLLDSGGEALLATEGRDETIGEKKKGFKRDRSILGTDHLGRFIAVFTQPGAELFSIGYGCRE
jgi:hypothetical protein